MKRKCIGMLMALVMMAMYCAPVLAANDQTETEAPTAATITDSKEALEYLENVACEAFPEYEAKIRGEVPVASNANDVMTRSGNADSIVVQETSQISENETVTYTEYAGGYATTALLVSVGKNITKSATSGNTTTYIVNGWANRVGSDNLLMVNGVSLTVSGSQNSAYGYASNISNLTTAISPMLNSSKSMGTSSNSAYVEYVASFEVITRIGMIEHVALIPTFLKFYISGNQPAVSGY